jgi:hypothetical protein
MAIVAQPCRQLRQIPMSGKRCRLIESWCCFPKRAGIPRLQSSILAGKRANNVRICNAKPRQQVLQTLINVVDVEGRYFH